MEYKIGKRIKELRNEAGLTQKQVAKLLNKSETGFASWEQGLSEPCVNDLRLLCVIFNVSADEFLCLDNPTTKAQLQERLKN
ncbi:MAG: helix-turn-helix transcriptional regulator [Clostridia bacterium]|nr:helix-turn-helix transcriptional regulator [Clostridia bacterium]